MEGQVLVRKENGREYISRERKLSILVGVGYVLLMFVIGTANGLISLDGKLRLGLLIGFVALAVILGLTGFFKKDSEDLKGIKNGNFLLEDGYFIELKAKYDKVKYSYNFVYFVSLLGVIGIIGRSFYIVVVYKACPQNDITVFALGSFAMFCFSYASGVIGAYKHLLKGGRRGEV